MEWIYLKSDKQDDALALATVLSATDKNFNIVRRSGLSAIFNGMKNVTIDFFRKDDAELVEIEELETDSFPQKCSLLYKMLGVVEPSSYKCYTRFQKDCEQIKQRWGEESRIMIYLIPHSCQQYNLVLLDQMARLFEQRGIYACSCGSNMMPCLKGTKDFRQLINVPEIFALKEKIKFVLTSEKDIISICEAFDIPAFIISDGDNMSINNVQIDDAAQIVNYILKSNK